MFGLKYKDESFGNFGRLGRRKKSKFQGLLSPAPENRKAIGDALAEVIQMKSFERERFEKSFNRLHAIHGCGSVLASRLLVFARPDWCVVPTKKSFECLTEELGFQVSNGINSKRYADLIEAIQRKPWWQSTEPLDPKERQLWIYRAALIDSIAFDIYNR